MQQVCELLEEQKTHYKEHLLQQENSYKNITQIIMNTANQRVDELMKEVHELKSSLHFTQKEMDKFKLSCKKLSSDCGSNENGIHKLAESLLTIDSKSEYPEGQLRRNNIVVDGIPESPNEKWSDSEEKVQENDSREATSKTRVTSVWSECIGLENPKAPAPDHVQLWSNSLGLKTRRLNCKGQNT